MKIIMLIISLVSVFSFGYSVINLGYIMFGNVTNDGVFLNKVKDQHQKSRATNFLYILVMSIVIPLTASYLFEK